MKRFGWLVLCAAIAACGDSSNSPDAGPTADAAPIGDAPPRPARLRGRVEVLESQHRRDNNGSVEITPQGRVLATFLQDALPTYHREVAAEGDCVLRRYTPALCEPVCDGFCVDTNVCVALPVNANVGELTITGTTPSFTISPDQFGYYWPDVVPTELHAPGTTVSASWTGGDLPPRSISSTVPPALAVTWTDANLELINGQDVQVTWTPANLGDRVRLTLNSNNAGHGSPYSAIIECEADDADGQLTVPQSMIDVFPETMAWQVCAGSDCPPSSMRRVRTNYAAVADDAVELSVGSEILFGVIHAAP